MLLKGASPDHDEEAADKWPVSPELETVAKRWDIELETLARRQAVA
jgi:hypothetical protein